MMPAQVSIVFELRVIELIETKQDQGQAVYSRKIEASIAELSGVCMSSQKEPVQACRCQ
jgi:hypothetical protein